MKISLNWIRDYLVLDKQPSEIADILTSLGLEVEGWEIVKPSAVDLHLVLTGLVVECSPIPDTDHLTATKVDVGDGILRSVVCGAPNVAAGQKVLLAQPGANVFSKDGQLFTIGERKVRGVLSQGMICAEDELGIGHDHSGIMVLPADTPLGIPADKLLKQDSDVVIEIGLTPNRADATNHLGVARDLAAYLRVQEKQTISLRFPAGLALPEGNRPFKVTVENTEACPRYAGILIEGVTVGPSPEWLQQRLLAVGQRPINNIVDITNYVRLELGQPLHAFDADQVKGDAIVVKTLPAGTKFKTLDEVERTLFAEDLMICDGASNPLCMGGVFGGASSGVQDSTTRVFLESACFHPSWIRRSMLRHNLRTDAAWNFEKGVDPNGCRIALERAVEMILEHAGGELRSDLFDHYPNPVRKARVEVAYDRVNALIGVQLDRDTLHNILRAQEIDVTDERPDGFTAHIPTCKPDVTREADVVEEILRVYGLDNIPMPSHIRSSMEITPQPDPDAIRNLAADLLAANGFHEAMNLSLSNSAYYAGETPVLPVPAEALVYVHNTANQGLDCLRPALLLSGLESIRHNQNRQNPDLFLFEFGKVYRREADQFGETQRLGLWITGARQPESWQPAAKEAVDFYTLKAYVHQLLNRLGISGYQETTLEPETGQGFQFGLRYHRGPQELASFGRVAPGIQRAMDVRNPVYFADFHFDNMLAALANNSVRYQELSRFPSVRRDLALVVDRQTGFGEIRQLATKTAKKLLKEVNLFDVFEDESKLGAGKKSYAVSFLFENSEKTLQDKEIDNVMQELQTVFQNKLNALIRQ